MDPSSLTKLSSAATGALSGGASTVGGAKAMNGTSGSHADKMAPPAASIAPRVEIQPSHEALKGALTKENWMSYTESLNKFLRGVCVDGADSGMQGADMARMQGG